jgi:hypothetical protein
MRGGFAIPQPSECNITAPGRGFGLVHSKAVMSAPLLRLHIREQSIRFGQFACVDGLLRISFQGSDLGMVTGLS